MVFENFKFILNGTCFNLTKVCFSDSYINVFIWDKTNRYFLFKILMDYNYSTSVSIRYCIIADKVFIRIGRSCYVLDVKEYKKFLKLCFVKEDIINWKEDGF